MVKGMQKTSATMREEHGRWGSLDGGGSELTFGGAYSFRPPLLSAGGVVMMVARAKCLEP